MRSPIVPLPLILTSLSAFAFNPVAQGWYGESTLSPTISSVSYHGTGKAGGIYGTGTNPPEGDFTLLGINVRQSVGWREWFSLDLSGGYSGALNGTANRLNVDIDNAMPAGLKLWDLRLESFTSIALDSVGSVYIEPAVGYELLVANMRVATEDLPKKKWVHTNVYGPALALYLRLFLTDKVSLRFGSKYQASQMRTKSYRSPEGAPYDKYHSTARRHSLGALVRFDYAWRSWVYLHAAVDYQSWSAGGPNPGFNTKGTGAPLLERTRFTWGVDFAY